MNENSVKKHTLYVMGGVAVMLLLWASFGGRGDHSVLQEASVVDVQAEHQDVATVEDVPMEPVKVNEETPEVAAAPQTDNVVTSSAEEAPKSFGSAGMSHEIAMLLASAGDLRAVNPYEAHLDSMPGGGRKMKINYLGGTLGRVFNDSNYLHIATAEKIGIKPLSGIRSAWEAGARLERLQSCRDYYLDDLTHSLPYLVPAAHRLLADIGAAFRDSLQARGGGDYRIKVTSVLRTPRLIRHLRRRNRNAVDTSAHLFGTTFDISYAKFICDSASVPRTQEDLKNLLGEVVFAMREKGRCYVKYERKQACFHITAR